MSCRRWHLASLRPHPFSFKENNTSLFPLFPSYWGPKFITICLSKYHWLDIVAHSSCIPCFQDQDVNIFLFCSCCISPHYLHYFLILILLGVARPCIWSWTKIPETINSLMSTFISALDVICATCSLVTKVSSDVFCSFVCMLALGIIKHTHYSRCPGFLPNAL